jgi:chemotaxis protein CheC
VRGPLTALQIDALCEAANIGAGHAATALSQLTQRRVHIDVTNLVLLDQLEPILVPELELAVAMHVLGDLGGRLFLLFTESSAASLSGLLLNRPVGTQLMLDEMTQSALQECANVLAGAYVGALSALTGKVVLLSAPSLVPGRLDAISRHADAQDVVFRATTKFRVEGDARECIVEFMLMASLMGLTELLAALSEKRPGRIG